MAMQPTGTVTMLFTDVEGSTRLLDRLGGDRYADALELHRRVLREACARHAAYEVSFDGDSFFFAFDSASNAVEAAVEAQRELERTEWPEGLPFRVRMGIHSGEVMAVPSNYVGLEVHRAARIMAAAHGGQVLISKPTKDSAGTPAIDLGEHRLKDLLQPVRLYQLQTGGEDRFPPLRSLGNHPTNLPIQPNELVGRTREIGELIELLGQDEVRLVTLTGTGGTGKTRLALHVAADATEQFASGVFAVFLASVRDPADVALAVAHALAVREAPGEDIVDTLIGYLGDRELLLVVDNFEHVPAAAPILAGLLSACPGLKVLATSRTRLRLRAERVYEVQVLADDDALTLLLARTHALGRGKAQGGGEPELAEICRRLDRLPLALELAAPLLSIFGPAELLARLDRRLELLADGPLDVSERQQTLRNTIEWSYELLPASARELLARSSVFVGGAPCDAIEPVCETSLEELARLTEGSLGRVEENRFVMLESIQSFAAERLQLAGQSEAVQDRHARHFLEVARAADARLSDQDTDALEVFQNDHDNLRAALGFFAAFDRQALLDLAANCGWFWFIRGHLSEGRRWLDAALEATEDAPLEIHAKALMRKGVIAELQDDLEVAEQALSQALELRRAINDVFGASAALSNLGNIAVRRDDYAGAKRAYTEALAIGREIGDAEACGSALCNLAMVAEIEKDYPAAELLLEESLAFSKVVGNRYGQSVVEQLIGMVAIGSGDLDRACAFFASSLQIACELDSPELIVVTFEELAFVASMRRDAAAGAYILGAATGVRDQHGLHARMGGKRALALDTIQSSLDEATYAGEFSAGADASADEAVAYAFERILGAPAKALQRS